ncbi:hypothetical protein SAMN05216525_10883 [Bradyrhizobium sp. Gha]|nr:hypothetical protein SAMN05216525_10883 [Bradyrhizobium sp. Gha]
MQSQEWKGIVVGSAIALLSVSLLAADALMDLSASALVKRLQSAGASFVDTMGQHQLAFAVRAWTHETLPQETPTQETWTQETWTKKIWTHETRAHGKAAPEPHCQSHACGWPAAGTDSSRKQDLACRPAITQAFSQSLKKMVGARGFEPPTPSLPDAH